MIISPILPKAYTITPAPTLKTSFARPLSCDSVHFSARFKQTEEDNEPKKTSKGLRRAALVALLAITIACGAQTISTIGTMRQSQRRTAEMSVQIEEIEARRAELELQLSEAQEKRAPRVMSDEILNFSEKYPNVYYDPNDEGILEFLPNIEQEFDMIFERYPNLGAHFKDSVERFCVASGDCPIEVWERFGLSESMSTNLNKESIEGVTSTDGKYVGVEFHDNTYSRVWQAHEFCHTLLDTENEGGYNTALNADLEENLSKLEKLDIDDFPSGLFGQLMYSFSASRSREHFAVLGSYLLLANSGVISFEEGATNPEDIIEVQKGTVFLREYFPKSCEFIEDLFDTTGTQKVVNNP